MNEVRVATGNCNANTTVRYNICILEFMPISVMY